MYVKEPRTLIVKENGLAPVFLAWLAADCAASPCKPLQGDINGSHNSNIAVFTYMYHSNSAPRIRQLDRWRFISLYYYFWYGGFWRVMVKVIEDFLELSC